MRMIMTYKNRIYKDESKNPKAYCEYDIVDDSHLPIRKLRLPPHYGYVDIETVMIIDGDKITDITSEINCDRVAIHWALREIFSLYNVQF